MPDSTAMCPSSSLHLCARDHDGSSHPSLGGGLGCQGHRVPAGLIRSLSPGGCQAAAGLMGEVVAGLEAHEQHGRGVVPGAAAAARRPEDRQTPSGSEGARTEQEADTLNPL